jgi:hypothetical protein
MAQLSFTSGCRKKDRTTVMVRILMSSMPVICLAGPVLAQPGHAVSEQEAQKAAADAMWSGGEYRVLGSGEDKGTQISGHYAEVLTRDQNAWHIRMLIGTLSPVEGYHRDGGDGAKVAPSRIKRGTQGGGAFAAARLLA